MSHFKPTFPRWYDANASCDYHAENSKHSTELYRAKVQSSRIGRGWGIGI